MQVSSIDLVEAPCRLWQLQRADGYTLHCDIEPNRQAWMVWFSVDGQRIGGHSFTSYRGAKEWSDSLLCELQKKGVVS